MKAAKSTFSALGARIDAAWAGLRGLAFGSPSRDFLTGADLDDRAGNRLVEPYAQSPWAYAAVNLIAGEIAGRPLKFYQGDKEYADAAFAAWWEAPALGVDTLGRRQRKPIAAVLRELAGWAKLEGEFFIALDDEWLLATAGRAGPRLAPFLILEPGRVRLIVQGGVLMGYEHTDTAGRRHVFVPDQVRHWKAFNPYDAWRGLGAQQVARVATEGAFLTGTYIRDLMRNNGDQGYIVVGKSGIADENQKAQISAALATKRAALRRGKAIDIFLTGDIAVDRPPERGVSTEIASGKTTQAQEIFTAYGVPASMAEAKTNYSQGKDSDRYQLITGTCQPLGTDICGELSQVAARMSGRALTADLDWDDHPVMVEVRYSRVETGLKLWTSGMPMQKVNDYLDLGLPSYSGWEKGYLPFSVVEIGGEETPSSDPVKDPALTEEQSMSPEFATLQGLIAARSRARMAFAVGQERSQAAEVEALAAFTCGCGCLGGNAIALGAGYIAQKADRPAAEVARWREHMKHRRETVVAFKSAFGRVLMQARIETLRKIEDQGAKAIGQKAAVSDFLFDLTKFTGEFQSAMRKQQTAGLDRAGTQLLKELGRDDPFRFAPAKVLQFLSQRENKLRNVPQQAYDRLRDSLAEGYDAGETTAQLAARAKKVFNGLADIDAQRIAQSETAAVYGTGRHEAMREAGVKYKAWLTSGNANVREAHQLAGLTYSPDTPIPVDEPFVVDGEELMHPGDSAGSPGNTINCHCVEIAVAAPEK